MEAALALRQCTSRIFVRSGCASIYHSTAKAGRPDPVRVQPCTNPASPPPRAHPHPRTAAELSSTAAVRAETLFAHAYSMRDDTVVEPTLIKYSVLIVDLACQARRAH